MRVNPLILFWFAVMFAFKCLAEIVPLWLRAISLSLWAVLGRHLTKCAFASMHYWLKLYHFVLIFCAVKSMGISILSRTYALQSSVHAKPLCGMRNANFNVRVSR